MNKRIFISFAKEDIRFRDLLVGQAKNKKSPFEFIDMSVKTPWIEKWKTQCRIKIKGCNGLIVLLSKDTIGAKGARWEIKCALEEDVPVRGIYISRDGCTIPPELKGKRVVYWTWSNISTFLNSL